MTTQTSSDATAEAVWFYEDNGQRQGPSTRNQLLELIRTSKIAGDTPIWRTGLNDWIRLEDSELAPHLAVRSGPPPLAGHLVNNNVAWVLALAPLIGLFLEYFIAGAVMQNEYVAEEAVDSGKFFYITVALNIALSYFDEKRVRAAGHDTSKFRGLTWLVPVYLFQRAKLLNQTPAYFWVWIATFVFTLL